MKKMFVFALCCISILVLTVCGNQSNTDKPDAVPSPVHDETESTDIIDIVGYFDEVQSYGTKLFDCFTNFDTLDKDSKYQKIKEAENYTDSMREKYNEILGICKEVPEYGNIEFQTKLLEHLIPQPIQNDAQAISNATVLYQMYFQQISSSFSYLSEDMEHISNGEPLEIRTSYFDELSKMPKPDTIIYGISLVNTETEDGVINYTYNSGDDDTDAQMNYNLYLIALGMDTGLTLQYDGAAAYVFDGDNMVSALMAGTDAEIGNFFMASFPQR